MHKLFPSYISSIVNNINPICKQLSPTLLDKFEVMINIICILQTYLFSMSFENMMYFDRGHLRVDILNNVITLCIICYNGSFQNY